MKYTFTSTNLELVEVGAEELSEVSLPETSESHVVKDSYDVTLEQPDGEGGYNEVDSYSSTGYFTKEVCVAKQARYATLASEAEAGSDEKNSHQQRADLWQGRTDAFTA